MGPRAPGQALSPQRGPRAFGAKKGKAQNLLRRPELWRSVDHTRQSQWAFLSILKSLRESDHQGASENDRMSRKRLLPGPSSLLPGTPGLQQNLVAGVAKKASKNPPVRTAGAGKWSGQGSPRWQRGLPAERGSHTLGQTTGGRSTHLRRPPDSNVSSPHTGEEEAWSRRKAEGLGSSLPPVPQTPSAPKGVCTLLQQG